MDSELLNRLIVSFQQRRLVLFCGAGLSMAAPSGVPAAAALTQQVMDEYRRRALPALSPTTTSNLETLADHLFAGGLQSLFVRDLVAWRPFRRNPNIGHRAVGDFLTSGAVPFVATTNFDELVELSAMELGEDSFKASLTSDEANVNHGHQPLLKIHGCVRDVDHTLWCRRQLDGAPPVSPANITVRARLASAQQWLRANLPEKDLVFLGFWSDWSYLNSVLSESVHSVHAPFVVLVDPQSDAVLSAKAPELWTWANGSGEFIHVPEKGEDFLTELRTGFSKNLLERVLQSATAGFQLVKSGVPVPPVSFDGIAVDDLYAVRRDVGGVSSLRIAKYFNPDPSMDAVGRAHLLLRHAGATMSGPRFISSDLKRIRVVNGKTKLISQIRQEFSEEPPLPATLGDDIVICAGASEDGGVPSHIVRGSTTATVVRSGTSARWISLETAIGEGLC